jgi:DNA-binding NarL/FixJ family response regulator
MNKVMRMTLGRGYAQIRNRTLTLPESRDGKARLVMAGSPGENSGRQVQRLRGEITVCEVTDRRTLERVVATLKPAVLIVDLALSGLRRVRGLPAIQRLSPSTRIVALSETPDEREGVLALKAGARGYCARTIDPESLMKAVEAVQGGEIWAPRRLVPRLVAELVSLMGHRERKELRPKPGSRLEKLTQRQRTIADLISRGASNKEIANRLQITERTVKAHLTEAFRKAGVSDRLQLALLLQEPPPEAR